jgi:hypothetical protein
MSIRLRLEWSAEIFVALTGQALVLSCTLHKSLRPLQCDGLATPQQDNTPITRQSPSHRAARHAGLYRIRDLLVLLADGLKVLELARIVRIVVERLFLGALP